MDNKLNSVPSVGTEVEKSTNVEVSSVNPNDTKPIVGCSANLPFLNTCFIINPKNSKQSMAIKTSDAIRGYTYDDYLANEQIAKRLFETA